MNAVDHDADLADQPCCCPFSSSAKQVSDVSHILLRGPDARVHWWYWPDSYDSWIPVDQAPDADDPDKPSRGRVQHPLPFQTCGM